MRRGVRRSAVLAVLALAGSLALTGCGSTQPGTAAYIGDTRYTEKQVDELVDEIRASAVASRILDPRAAAVSYLVRAELAARATADMAITVSPPDLAGTARALGLPSESVMTRLLANWNAAANALAQRIEPVQASDVDLREIFDHARKNPTYPADLTFEQMAQNLREDPDLPRVLGVRNVLRDQAARSDIVVNPRYRPLFADIGGVPLAIAEPSDVVTDPPIG